MSHVRQRTWLERLRSVRSVKSFAQSFLLETMAGQKLFLHANDLPRVINISMNEKTCFYSCTMCPYADTAVRAMYAQNSEMSFDTLKNIVASIPNDPYYSFDISAIGETLQFARLPEFIAYMKRTKPLVNTIVSTNGLLLSESVFLALARSGLDNLQVSLFAENADDHETITKTKSFARVKENLLRAAMLKRSHRLRGPYLQTFMMEAEETRARKVPFVSYWSAIVDHAFSRPIYNLGRKIEGLTAAFDPPRKSERYPCIVPWYSTAIRSNGDVLHCYMFHWNKDAKERKVGNINETSLRDIWQEPAFLAFRKAHLEQQLDEYPVCQSCDGWAAYTNVWRRANQGFEYAPLRPRDLLTRAAQQRGG